MPKLKTLPDKYYLQHARELFSFVQNECKHLLDGEHEEYLHNFSCLSEDAQCLLVRCLARKPHFLKKATLLYTEIGDLPNALKELSEYGYVSEIQTYDWRDLARTLTKPQLLSALKASHYAVRHSTLKAELVELAQRHTDLGSAELQSLFNEFIVRRKTKVFDYIIFLFFGDLNQRFEKFAMRDLGVLKTRKSEHSNSARFDSKLEAQSAFCLLHHQRDFNAQPQETRETVAQYLLQSEANGSAAIEIKDKLLLNAGSAFAHDMPKKAIELWRKSQHPQAVEKWVRETYKANKDTLKEELVSLQKTSLNASTRVFIEDFYARKYLGKRTSIYTDMLREPTDTLAIDEAYLNDVESGVIDSYQRQGKQALFSENRLWRVLFSFTFWDLLFGAKHTQYCEFDRLPALLRNRSFYETFKEPIEKCLLELQSHDDLLRKFTKLATTHYGKPTGLFRWKSDTLDMLAPCVRYSPNGAIAGVLRRMAQDYRNTKDGYPDLMVVQDQQIHFEEIKAPGDQLRPNQLVSINRLRRTGFDVRITQIEWSTNPDQIYAVIDIETTGSRKGGNSITEIAIVKVRNQEIISEWSTLINPQRHIPAHITRLTGIDDTMVAKAPLFTEITDYLSAQLENCIFVAHNVGFDYGFIKAAYEASGLVFRKPKYCTVANARKAFPGLKSYSLSALTQHFDINLQGAHRALNDARATADLLCLIQSTNEQNQK